MQRREALLLEALGSKLGVAIPSVNGKGCLQQREWEAIQLLQRCGPLLPKSAESLVCHQHTKEMRMSSGAHSATTVLPVTGPASGGAHTSRSAIVDDISAAEGVSAPKKMQSAMDSLPIGMPEALANMPRTLAPLDPVQRHCISHNINRSARSGPGLHNQSAIAGPGVVIGPEWRLVRMVRERVPVDLLQRVSPDAEYESVYPILERLLNLVVSRLEV